MTPSKPSTFSALAPTPAPTAAPEPPELPLRRQLLGVVLRDTLKKTGVPADWIGGEARPVTQPDGDVKIEVLLSVRVDEPRLLAYLSSFQASYGRRLLAIEPDAGQWLLAITWQLRTDPAWEVAMPKAEYWALVRDDRDLTAKQNGAADWAPEDLARHFSDTNPGELLVDFDDTQPPPRDIENISRKP